SAMNWSPSLLIAPNPTRATGAPLAMSKRAQPVASARGGLLDGWASTSTAISSVVSASGNATRRAIAMVSPSPGRASELVPIRTLSAGGGSRGSAQWPAVSTTVGAIRVPVQPSLSPMPVGNSTATTSGHLPAAAFLPPMTDGGDDGDTVGSARAGPPCAAVVLTTRNPATMARTCRIQQLPPYLTPLQAPRPRHRVK